MTTAERIQKLRIAKGMTQEEMGIAIHFNRQNASARIAQYEMGIRNPSRGTIQKFVDAFGINGKALTGPTGYSPEDVMQILFDLEDAGYRISIHRRGNKVSVEIYSEKLQKPLRQWQKEMNRRKVGRITERDYIIWKFCWKEDAAEESDLSE